MRRILNIDCVELSTFVHALRDRGRHQGTYSNDRRGQSIYHVAPMRHHIERNAASGGTSIVPARALAFLRRAIEDPRPSIYLDRENSAEEAGILHEQQFCETGQE